MQRQAKPSPEGEWFAGASDADQASRTPEPGAAWRPDEIPDGSEAKPVGGEDWRRSRLEADRHSRAARRWSEDLDRKIARLEKRIDKLIDPSARNESKPPAG